MAADPVDWANPCARAAALGAAYYALLQGQQEQRIRFRSGDDEDEVWYQPAKLDVLRTEMKAAQAACEALTTGRTPRRAITAG